MLGLAVMIASVRWSTNRPDLGGSGISVLCIGVLFIDLLYVLVYYVLVY